MTHMRHRTVKCTKCDGVITIDANLDTHAVRALVPNACASAEACAAKASEGIFSRSFGERPAKACTRQED